MNKGQNAPRLDLDFFEYLIAFNCTFNEIYLASVVDYLKPKYVKHEGVRQYLEIVFDFFHKHSQCPSPTEIKAYLSTNDQKQAFKDVVVQFKQLDKESQKEYMKYD